MGLYLQVIDDASDTNNQIEGITQSVDISQPLWLILRESGRLLSHLILLAKQVLSILQFPRLCSWLFPILEYRPENSTPHIWNIVTSCKNQCKLWNQAALSFVPLFTSWIALDILRCLSETLIENNTCFRVFIRTEWKNVWKMVSAVPVTELILCEVRCYPPLLSELFSWASVSLVIIHLELTLSTSIRLSDTFFY
jgi:hypothetical protein